MAKAMDAENLMSALSAKEFRPVDLHLVDGRTLRVEHPDFFLIFPNRKAALVFPDGVHFELLNLEAIVRAVPGGNPATPNGAPPASS